MTTAAIGELPAPLAAGVLTPDAARALLAEHRFSAATRRAYITALTAWSAWHALRYGDELPLLASPRRAVPAGVVIQWVLDHVAGQMPADVERELITQGVKAKPGSVRMTTLRQRLAALASWHRIAGFPTPTEDPAVREILKAAGREAAERGEIARTHDALVVSKLERLLATCDGSEVGVRDRAILLVGFASGGRRPDELSRARIEDLVRYPRKRGQCDYELRLQRGKTFAAATAGEVRRKPVAGDAADALSAWLDRLASAGMTSGPLFRRIWPRPRQDGRSRIGERALSARSISRMVAARARLAGVEGPISGRSVRSGFVTSALAQGHDLGAIMQLTDHARADTVYRHYQRPGEGLSSPLANLLEEAAE